MKYAFMSFSCPQASLDEALALAQKHGYDGFEPRCGIDHRHRIEIGMTKSDVQSTRDSVEQSGVELSCLAIGRAASAFAAESSQQQTIDETRRYIDLADQLGVRRLRIFGGHYPSESSREEAIDRLASSLRDLTRDAQDADVALCLETHDSWCDPRHVAEVMKRVDHPKVAVNWDIMHPVRTGASDMQEAFDILSPWIQYVHFHDGTLKRDPLEFKPAGKGEYDLTTAMKSLVKQGYHGWISGEWINTGDTIDLAEELAAFKALQKSVV